QEQQRADDAEHGADRDLVGVADEAADNVRGQHQAGAGEPDPGQRAAHVVAHDGAHQVGNDEAEKRDRAGGDDDGGGDHGDDAEPDGQHAPVVEPDIGGEILAQSGGGEPVGGEIGDDAQPAGDPQHLVAATQ